MVLFPDTHSAEAAKIAERIRSAVEQLAIFYCSDVLTQAISIGFTTSPSNSGHNDLDLLINTADTGLYAAKAAGRNRVERAYP